MNVRAIKTRLFKEREDLVSFITSHVKHLKNGSILAVTSKIVALSEGRVVDKKQKDAIIQSESTTAMKTKYVWLTIKDGVVMANAGVDASNADGKLILLPHDAFKTADTLSRALKATYKIQKFGIVITDSRTTPLRAGVTGAALGYAGFQAVRDYRKKRDLYGRPFEFTRTNVADSLASAATFLMGEGAERQPLAVIEDAPVTFSARINSKELLIPLKDDMYQPLFARGFRKSVRRKK